MGWLTGCLIFLCAACNTNSNTYNSFTLTKQDSLKALQKTARAILKIDTAKKIVATGDLVVRTGNDFTSESLRSLNQRDKTYSHCGIASIENDTVFVYHALGGELIPISVFAETDLKILQHPKATVALAFTATGFLQQIKKALWLL
jgi:hypothetical protein